MKKLLVALAGLLSALYLMNPTIGVFELLPDNLPFIGNLDEAAAAAVLIGVLRYFGIDIGAAFQRKRLSDTNEKK